ncbi:hypothetical protein GT028_04105 [Streptomyces sp. SID2999]|uniref:PEP/pyruvate-binding domain-containing protein n=1 Tax=Streptomyces sp. SID2999 TaxID=2690258 RepID=UPI00137178B8|nr:PEP/pyruvate-binding domain-containing protein [Streptomyces sp. SID2999]MYZ06558.1 hypothetical protein [Streptomyces sp. SID2999]
MDHYVFHFGSGHEVTRSRLGGKGASLASLAAAGVVTPPGFVVTTEAFDAVLAQDGLRSRIEQTLRDIDPDDLAATERAGETIRRAVLGAQVPADVHRELDAAYRSLTAAYGREVPVAVRSSATAEDRADASGAGQQDTFLWVVGSGPVLDAVRRCWAGLFSSRAIVYRARHRIPSAGLSMAVVVQKMVPSRVAGVAMTLDPGDGDHSQVVIDASWGIGELLVSGEVTPDHYVVDKATLSPLRTTVSDKREELVADTRAGVLVRRQVEERRRTHRCLTPEEVSAVARLAITAEEHYGVPQDVEWAIDPELPGPDRAVLLQSRPETVWSGAPDDTPGQGRAAVAAGGTWDGTRGKRFPSPREIAAPPGAEGWERLYPYYLVFQEGLRATDERKFWFCDQQHWPKVLKPFETIGVEFSISYLGYYNNRYFLIPRAAGIECRIHHGYVYLSPVAVPAEAASARTSEFLRRAGHYYDNWDALLEQWKREVLGTIAELEQLDFAPLVDAVPFGQVESGAGPDPSDQLSDAYDRLIRLCRRSWQHHMEFLNLGYAAYLDFFEFCNHHFPGIPEAGIAAMVQGADMELFRPDDELKALAKLALALGVADPLRSTDDTDRRLAAVARAPRGQEWLTAWEEAQNPWFNFTSGNGFYGSDKYWLDHPSIPLGYIADYIDRLERGHDIDRHVDDLVAERAHITEEYCERLPPGTARDFTGKLDLARRVYPYVENHNFYIEHWTMGVFWRKVRQLSRMLHEAGFWEAPDDLLYLTRDEVRQVLFDYVSGWSAGTHAVGTAYWPEEVARRKAIVEALAGTRPEPALNEPPQHVAEPFTIMLWGATPNRMAAWLGGFESTRTVTGMTASPGTVEGVARVVTDADELRTVRDGDVLVAPIMAPSWSPVFGRIRAAVTDVGGMMSHAAIVCREYRLPAVTGTGNASTLIKTGQRIRVDGSRGIVTILD